MIASYRKRQILAPKALDKTTPPMPCYYLASSSSEPWAYKHTDAYWRLLSAQLRRQIGPCLVNKLLESLELALILRIKSVCHQQSARKQTLGLHKIVRDSQIALQRGLKSRIQFRLELKRLSVHGDININRTSGNPENHGTDAGIFAKIFGSK